MYPLANHLAGTYTVLSSIHSSHDLRRVASANVLSLDQRRQEIELKRLEIKAQKELAEVKEKEEQTRLQQLENDRLELELLEKRRRIQDSMDTL